MLRILNRRQIVLLPIDQTLTQTKYYSTTGKKLIPMSTFFTKELTRRTKPRLTLSTYHRKTLITVIVWKIVAAIKSSLVEHSN